jgi:glycerophosphoryl diester phosphodiesterase
MSTQVKRGENFFVPGKYAVDVVAHRGGGGQWPGETFFAFRNAVNADVLEFDLRITSDDKFVLMHNANVNDTTNGVGLVRLMKLSEIQKLDAGYKWTNDGGATYPFRGKGISVPTLEETLQELKPKRMNIEIKGWHPLKGERLAAHFCEVLAAAGMEDKVLVASFHTDILRTIRRLSTKIATSAATFDLLKFVLGNKFGKTAKVEAEAIQISPEILNRQVIDQKLLSRAHAAGLPLHAWTINERPEMRRFIDLGVDGIITDFPDLLVSELQSGPQNQTVPLVTQL